MPFIALPEIPSVDLAIPQVSMSICSSPLFVIELLEDESSTKEYKVFFYEVNP